MLHRALLLLGVVAVGAAGSAALSAPQRTTVACTPATIDIACRIAAVFKLTPTPGVVPDSVGRTMGYGSYARTMPPGAADLYFGRRAICRELGPRNTPGTYLRSRRPQGYLFTQYYGRTLCTFANLSTALVTNARRVPAGARQEPAPEPFFAAIEAAAAKTQVRIVFVPDETCAIAVLRGSLIVRLPNDDLVRVAAGEELTITLDRSGTVASRETGPASFDASERKIYTLQLRKS